MGEIFNRVLNELKHHAPFTFLGALLGIIFMILIVEGNYLDAVNTYSKDVFFILHPAHVFFSAIVTTTLWVKYQNKNILWAILIGYTGAIGIATLSDSIIPYLGEQLLNLPHSEPHIGFIDKPLITNIPAFVGIIVGYWNGTTKIPHAGHVLISTWASLFHVIMAVGASLTFLQLIVIVVFLFLAVWLPCCTSDIVYPLVFTKQKN